jgi:hypothetical protein
MIENIFNGMEEDDKYLAHSTFNDILNTLDPNNNLE